MAERMNDPQTGPNVATIVKRNYSGTPPSRTLAWICAVAFMLLCWLVYAFGHTFGPDAFPQQMSDVSTAATR
jgi:hypothetical protein